VVIIPVIQLVGVNLATKRIPVNAKDLCRTRLISVRTVQNSLDKTLFELSHRFIKQNSPLHHLAYESF